MYYKFDKSTKRRGGGGGLSEEAQKGFIILFLQRSVVIQFKQKRFFMILIDVYYVKELETPVG